MKVKYYSILFVIVCLLVYYFFSKKEHSKDILEALDYNTWELLTS